MLLDASFSRQEIYRKTGRGEGEGGGGGGVLLFTLS